MTPFFHNSFMNAIIITIVYLGINHFDVYLEENYDITGYQKNYLKAPVQFGLVLVIGIIVHSFSSWIYHNHNINRLLL
jgi:hypothetical protein